MNALMWPWNKSLSALLKRGKVMRANGCERLDAARPCFLWALLSQLGTPNSPSVLILSLSAQYFSLKLLQKSSPPHWNRYEYPVSPLYSQIRTVHPIGVRLPVDFRSMHPCMVLGKLLATSHCGMEDESWRWLSFHFSSGLLDGHATKCKHESYRSC